MPAGRDRTINSPGLGGERCFLLAGDVESDEKHTDLASVNKSNRCGGVSANHSTDNPSADKRGAFHKYVIGLNFTACAKTGQHVNFNPTHWQCLTSKHMASVYIKNEHGSAGNSKVPCCDQQYN